jgi:fumarylacetoacetate (FAA) hydrolase
MEDRRPEVEVRCLEASIVIGLGIQQLGEGLDAQAAVEVIVKRGDRLAEERRVVGAALVGCHQGEACLLEVEPGVGGLLEGGGEVPEAWYRLPIFYFSNVSEIRGPGDPVWAPKGSTELDYELEVAALIDTPLRDVDAAQAEQGIGGYMIFNDWSARDLQREETTVRLGPAKGKDFATSIGPWLVTPDELTDARRGNAYDLAMTATVNGQETTRGTWSTAQFSFGQMIERASADVRLRAGDLIGSGTVGTGCLLEIRDTTIGRYLQPGDEVTVSVERLGSMTTPIVERG